MASTRDFHYATSDLLDHTYMHASRATPTTFSRSRIDESATASLSQNRGVSPPTDDEAELASAEENLPSPISNPNPDQHYGNASRVTAQRERLISARGQRHQRISQPVEQTLQSPPLHSVTKLDSNVSIEGTRYPSPTVSSQSRIVLAVDYGTTYTGCAIALTNTGRANLDEIEVLQSWQSGNQHKVRTIVSYANSRKGEVPWTEISDGTPAMVNTKLELEPQSSRKDELELTWYFLKGTGNLAFENLAKIGPNPAYSSKQPQEIVQDYLTHICQSALKPNAFETVDLAQAIQSNVPLDTIVTVPAKWSDQATAATFRAIRGAGFNKTTFPNLQDTILISEPEAAAFFAIRDHQLTSDIDLKPEDCFIVCDAGGGTVDAVSFQVKKTSPHLELERATDPDSAKCGSTFVDTAFKSWLREELGVEQYMRLDPLNGRDRLSVHAIESGPMRALIKDFVAAKHIFNDNSADVKLDLPAPLNNLDQEGRVSKGELIIYRDEMEDIFSDSINGSIALIDEQIAKLSEIKHRRARNVFLVGGFGASPWLQSQLLETCEDFSDSTLRRPEGSKSITAVVQGAVIYGIEKQDQADVNCMSACSESYAIRIDGRFEWLVRRGDLVLSSKRRSLSSRYFSIPALSCTAGRYDLALYRYIQRKGEDDRVPTFWEDGQNEVEVVGIVKCDFNDILSRSTQSRGQSSRPEKISSLSCRLELSEKSVILKVLHKNTALRGAQVEIGTHTEHQRVRAVQADHDWTDDF